MILDISVSPFWGQPTAKAKSDCVATRYIAEFINSLTNLAYVFYALYGISKLHRKPNSDVLRAVPYWGLMTVGICSTAYHVSLKCSVDDLSMLFTTTPVLHRVLTVNASRRDSVIMAILLGSILTGLVFYHVKTDELILHALSFASMVIVIGVRTMQLIKSRTLPGSAARRQIWGIVRFGAGLPLAWLLELHGWWHIFTAIGAYIFIAVIDHLVSGEVPKDIEKSFAWPAPVGFSVNLCGKSDC
ncbi:ceramidase [Aspergillus leporis]|uniref:Ceramidase n=1 Tax=Aspergillus leporis TaxID=41062 RepID=A0A5N5WV55_9EURO|nr:ceramidase [Aspergillus leporis]